MTTQKDETPKCPTCGRAPSMRVGAYRGEEELSCGRGMRTFKFASDRCPDEIHDRADRLAPARSTAPMLTAEDVAEWFDSEAERFAAKADRAASEDRDTSEASRLQDIADEHRATAYRIRVAYPDAALNARLAPAREGAGLREAVIELPMRCEDDEDVPDDFRRGWNCYCDEMEAALTEAEIAYRVEPAMEPGNTTAIRALKAAPPPPSPDMAAHLAGMESVPRPEVITKSAPLDGLNAHLNAPPPRAPDASGTKAIEAALANYDDMLSEDGTAARKTLRHAFMELTRLRSAPRLAPVGETPAIETPALDRCISLSMSPALDLIDEEIPAAARSELAALKSLRTAAARPQEDPLFVWAEEGGVGLRLSVDERGRVCVQVVDQVGCNASTFGNVLGAATIAGFRRQRIADFIAPKKDGTP